MTECNHTFALLEKGNDLDGEHIKIMKCVKCNRLHIDNYYRRQDE